MTDAIEKEPLKVDQEGAETSQAAILEQPDDYTVDKIQVLKGLEGVRLRPAMYIGNTAEEGLHHLVFEAIDNSIDESMAGYCSEIKVVIQNDGGISVEDNGRGIPVEVIPEEGAPALEVVLMKLHAGGKFDGGAYKVSGGLHGVGISVVNALSRHFIATVFRNGKVYVQEFERGEKKTELKETDTTKKRGTKVLFYPDPEKFEVTDFKFTILQERLRELAFLNKGLRITLQDERDGTSDTFKYSGGIKEFVRHLNKGKSEVNRVVAFEDETNGTKIEMALQYIQSWQEKIFSYANNIFTKEGGTHLVGFKSGLTRVINSYAVKNSLIKDKNLSLQGEDVREGITAVISIWLKNPQFEGQTKSALGNSDVKGMVESVVNNKLGQYLEENPTEARRIVAKVVSAAKAREAARRARDIERKRSGLDSLLHGRLADCHEKDPEKCELFIVEGESAGGTAKSGRNSKFQAILPIKGKILNVMKSDEGKVLSNEEVRSLLSCIGVSQKDGQEFREPRYFKIIIMTDADVDGAHIRTLLLTLFHEYTEQLIKGGYIYLAAPPLFRLRKGKTVRYLFSNEEKDKALKEMGKNVEISRFKGLGEMNAADLWETTMSPETRTLKRVTMDDEAKAKNLFDVLMGEDVMSRKKFIQEHAKFAQVDL